MNRGGTDPRLDPRAEPIGIPVDSGDPVVGRLGRSTSIFVIVGAFAILAVVLFLFLESRRQEQAASLVTPIANPSASVTPPAPALEIPNPLPAPAPAPEPLLPVPVAVAPMPLPAPAPVPDPSLRAPAVVVDLQSAVAPKGAVGALNAGSPVAASLNAGPGAAAPAMGAAGASPSSATAAAGVAGVVGAGALAPPASNEQFAARASGAVPEPAVAAQLTNLGTTITQGATIPGILETALNSDLPGFTRAIVSRDVRAFDGKAVLIPRGSRLIGEYRNGLSLGQSRVFVIWTRVIRPDGVSIQIGSPGGDELGRGGLTGDVNSHFFARFGGSILLSVLSAGTAAIAGTPSTQVTIGSPAAAAGAAAGAVIPNGADIPPTIKVMQGAAITIFVARDLDFTNVQPVR